MTTTTAFWILISITFIELMALYVLGSTIQNTLKSDFFRKKMDAVNKRDKALNKGVKKDNGGISTGILLIIFSLSTNFVFGLSPAPETDVEPWIHISKNTIYLVLAINIVLAFLLLYFKKLLTTLLNIDKTEAELETIRENKAINFSKILTDAVPIEEEYKVATDHVYDGIRELDNNLPPWWLYGFYASIVFACIYLVRYHVVKTGDLQIAEYNKDMEIEEANVKAYLISQAMNVDENTVIYTEVPAEINAGKKLYMQYCKVCHLDGGQGSVGPNLTDDYWIHGGKINDIFKTIKYGAQNGMKSWKDELNPVQMQQVSSFIKSLKGTNPPNPKEPQGELFVED